MATWTEPAARISELGYIEQMYWNKILNIAPWTQGAIKSEQVVEAASSSFFWN